MKKFEESYKKIHSFLKKYNKVYNIIILVLLCIFVGIVALNHEPSGDEVQAWLIPRDLSIPGVFKQMFSEGHPCLWHLILFPFAKLGCSIYVISFISYVIMMITAYLILFHSPFSKLVRTLIVFSSPFIYHYSIISRNYCLIALVLTLIALIYKSRHLKPILYGGLLFLLFNTHVIIAGMASILLFFFIVEILKDIIKTKNIPIRKLFGALIGFSGGIILCYQVFGSWETNSLVTGLPHSEYGYSTIAEWTGYIIRNLNMDFYFIMGSYLSWNIFYQIVYFFIIMIILNCFTNLKETIIFLVGTIFLYFVNYFVFYSITERALIIIFLLLFFSWIQKTSNVIPKNKIGLFLKRNKISLYITEGFLVLIVILTIYDGFYNSIIDIKESVADNPRIAEYIKENVNENAVILSTNENLTNSILGYLPGREFYSIENRRYFTFVNWDRTLGKEITVPDTLFLIDYFKEGNQEIYLLSAAYVYKGNDDTLDNLTISGKIELLYESERYYSFEEVYQLYKIVK